MTAMISMSIEEQCEKQPYKKSIEKNGYYIVTLRRNSDGATAQYVCPFFSPRSDDLADDVFWWDRNTGNMGSDCNRRMKFEWACGNDLVCDYECSESEYDLVSLVTDDGVDFTGDAKDVITT